MIGGGFAIQVKEVDEEGGEDMSPSEGGKDIVDDEIDFYGRMGSYEGVD